MAIPDDVDDRSAPKASGRVRIPLHVYWSGRGPDQEWDLDDSTQLAHVYEIVLTEGTEDDVRRFIDVDKLVVLWPRLYLSPWVRRAWAAWLRQHRGLEL